MYGDHGENIPIFCSLAHVSSAMISFSFSLDFVLMSEKM